ncbi:hypothetical protein [Halocalculus aciditolerans]|uniref:Uncharacterized protein n=1 Tax=Halocalculus aciditolerans TaxID=1383812 RepID=A0A830FI60_9EURY|nr:hypothetical protein [Halocalculus aciditolerans]GGL55134.1 hypothetical protein GCM10009039_11560 [Halocalculus aciditolerans]
MARNRIRAKATHNATVTERQETGTNPAGEPLYDDVEVVAGMPVRYQAAGKGWVREVAGERVREAPSMQVPATYQDDLNEGQTITLSDGREFTVVKINPRYGRAGVDHLELEVERSG